MNENLIFKYATDYYYSHPEPTDIAQFKLTDAEFSSFKNFLKNNNFNFETKAEKAFAEAFLIAKEEKVGTAIDADYEDLLNALNTYKTQAIDTNKNELLELLSDEIVKRYFYREGLYTYYKATNTEIQKGKDILSSISNYKGYLD